MQTLERELERAATAAPPGPAARARSRWLMPPPLRKAMLTLHVAISVGWLGLDIGLLVLGITGLTTGDPATLKAAYLAMDVFADVLVIPISLGALLTGVIVSIGTHWGLFKHWWVLVKFLITTGAATASIFALRGSIAEAAAGVRGGGGGDLDRVALSLVFAPTFALVLYTTMTVLSVFKPWGRTPYGRRRAAERKSGATAGRAARRR